MARFTLKTAPPNADVFSAATAPPRNNAGDRARAVWSSDRCDAAPLPWPTLDKELDGCCGTASLRVLVARNAAANALRPDIAEEFFNRTEAEGQ